jgi:hypothetical protein
MMPIVTKLEKELKIKIKKLEVWYNEKNADKMRECKNIILNASEDGDLGVPAFVDLKNKEALVGEQEERGLKEWLKEK